MVYEGLWRFMKVYEGLWRFMMAYGNCNLDQTMVEMCQAIHTSIYVLLA